MIDPKDTHDTDDAEELTSNDAPEQEDGEEEIFSNRPAHADDADDEFATPVDDQSEEVEVEDLDPQEETRRPEVRMRPKTVEELLLDAVPQRARSAGDKLKMHLTGKILIAIRNTTQRYVLDWSGADMVTAPATSNEAECTITISESDLMKISTGDLNPQILMLSHKVQVQGRSDHAMYVFNLIAPRGSL